MEPELSLQVETREGPTAAVPHANAERLRAIVDTAVDGIITTDANGIVETMNPAAVEMFGYAPHELVGRSITSLLAPDSSDANESLFAGASDSGARRILGTDRELLGQRRDGSTFPMELALSEMLLNERRMFTALVRDLTERRSAEEKLLRLAALLEDSNDAIVSMDLRGAITAWNPGARRLYCYSEPTALGMNMRELMSPEKHEELRQKLLLLETDERLAPFETQRVSAQGALLDVLCTLTLIKGRNGHPDTVVATDRDITERKKSEAALRGSEAKTRAIVEAAVDGIITIDARGLIESTNRAAERLFGYEASELLGRNVSMLMPAPYRDEHDGYIRRYQLTGVKKIIGSGREVVGLRRDGTTFPMELAISELRVDDYTLFTGIVRDLSDRKRIEEQFTEQTKSLAEANRILQDANLRAEEATVAKSAFLANMSHEIRTPMTAILGFAEQLQEKDATAEDQRQMVATIQRNGEYLLTILNDILDLSKIEAGKMDTEHVRFSPALIVAETVSLMRVRAEEKGLSLVAEIDSPIPAEVRSDPTRLRQILVNLVGNAIKFTKEGGVRILLDYDADVAAPVLRFQVIDSGIGLSDAQLPRLFRPFSQADASTTRKYGGTGLGLTISHRMAQLLGGAITVESESGVGSTFTVTISPTVPAGVSLIHELEDGLVETARPQVQLDEALQGLRLLLAEDGIDNQRLIGHVLRKAGAELDVVDHGQLAVDAACAAVDEGRPYDVVLMDMQMPVLSGYEATTMLRSRGYTRPIVALTANAMSGDRATCISAGCDDYATKPIQRSELIATIVAQAEHSRKAEAAKLSEPTVD